MNETATCPCCEEELPRPEDLVREWVCPCGHWRVLPVADALVLITRVNLQHLGNHHRVIGIGSLVHLGFEWWAVEQALKQDPELVRVLFSPN